LDASVDKDFAAAKAGKLDEVKKNLTDAHKLIALMKVRAGEVREESEQLLSVVSHAVDTDNGSLPAPGAERANAEAEAEAAKAAEVNAKKGPLKSKPKPAATASASAASAAAAKPKPKAAPLADGDEPAKAPAKPAKAPPAPRDFEP
jgi:hypothetical protein